MPTYDEFAARARSKYPDATETEMREAFAQKYGATPVRAQGPSREEFTSRAMALYPDAAPDEIDAAYQQKYGAPAGTEIWRGLKRSVGAPVMRGLGAMLGGLDLTDYRGLFGATGERMFNYGNEIAAANAPSREFQQQAWYSPEKLTTNVAGALGQVGTMAATLGGGIAPFVVDDAGQMAAELEAKGATRSEAQRIAIPYAIASSALERTGIERIMGRTPGRLVTGAVEGGTEVAQGALRDAGTGNLTAQSSLDTLGQEGVPAFVAGVLLGRSGRGAGNEEQEALSTAAGLVEPEAQAAAAAVAPGPVAWPDPALGFPPAPLQLTGPEPVVEPPPPPDFTVDPYGTVTPAGPIPGMPPTEATIPGIDATQAPQAPPPVAPEAPVAPPAPPAQAAPEPVPTPAAPAAAATPAPAPAPAANKVPPEVAPGPEVGTPPKLPKVPLKVYAQPEGEVVTPWARAQAPDLAPVLDAMEVDRGWFMQGKGVTMVNPTTAAGRREGRVFGHRNHWIPMMPWWDSRPPGTTEKKFDAVMKKLRAGKPITGENDLAIAEWIVDMAEGSVGRRDLGALTYQPTADDFAEFDQLNIETDALPVSNIARLLEADPESVQVYEKELADDPEAFDAAVAKRLDEIFGSPEDSARAQVGGPETGSQQRIEEESPRLDQQGRPIPQGQRSLPLDQPQQTPPGSSPEPLSLTPPEGSLRRSAKQLSMFAFGTPKTHNKTAAYARNVDEQPAFDFETRADTTPKQAEVGRQAVRSLLYGRDRRAGASVLGWSINQDFAERGTTSLVGQTVKTAGDVARLAQVYRDPRFETLRIIVVDDAGNVVGHSGMSSRLPGSVNWDKRKFDMNAWIRNQVATSGGTRFWFLHNHPSGVSTPSDHDIKLTADLGREFKDQLAGHVVIDHNEYSHITGTGSWKRHSAELNAVDFRANPQVPNSSLGVNLLNFSDVARLGVALKKPGFVTFITTDSQGDVQSIVEYPEQLIGKGDKPDSRVAARIQKLARESGASGHIFAVGENQPLLGALWKAKLITNYVRPKADGDYTFNSHHRNDVMGTRGRWTAVPYGVRESGPATGTGQFEPATGAQQNQRPGIPPIDPEVPGRTEIGGGDYAMNLLKGLTPEQFGALKWAMANLDSKVEAQRRGTRSWDTTMQAAADKIRAEYGISLDTLIGMKAGSTANAEQLATYGMLVAKATQDLEAALLQFRQTNSNEDMARAFAARERLAAMMTPFLGAKTEAGRALNILRANAKNFRSAAQIVDSIPENDAAALRRMADRIEHTGSLDQVIGTVQEDYTPDWLDKLLEWRVSMGLLSGVTTHQVNIISNTLFNMMDLVAQGAPVLIGKSDPRAYQARIAATWHGAHVGISNAVTAFKTERPVLTAGTKVDTTHMRAIKGKFGKFARIPVRLLMAEDEFFKSIAYHQHLADLAMSEAIRTDPADPVAAFNRLMGSPVDLINSGIADKAKGYADKMTFQTKLGPGLAGMVHGMSRGKGRLWRLVVPFVRTPYNIIVSAFEFSPLAFAQNDVQKALSNGGRDAAVAYARMGIGTTIMGSALALAAAGMVTGAGPDDENERRLWLAQGRQPYSIKWGDKWVQYNRFDPMGTIFGIAADLYDLAGYISDGDITKVGSALVTSIALNITDKTFLQGVTDFSEALSKPDRFMARYVNGLAATAVPNIAAQLARWMDPYQREARNFIDTVKSRIPVMREQLAQRIGITGDPVAENSATGLTMGAKVTTAQDNPLIDTMLRLGVAKGMPSRDIVIGRVRRELATEDYGPMAQFVQKARFDALTPIIQSPRFQALQQGSPEAARAMLEQGWDTIGSRARMAYLFQHPDVMQRAQAKGTAKSLATKYQEQGR